LGEKTVQLRLIYFKTSTVNCFDSDFDMAHFGVSLPRDAGYDILMPE